MLNVYGIMVSPLEFFVCCVHVFMFICMYLSGVCVQCRCCCIPVSRCRAAPPHCTCCRRWDLIAHTLELCHYSGSVHFHQQLWSRITPLLELLTTRSPTSLWKSGTRTHLPDSMGLRTEREREKLDGLKKKHSICKVNFLIKVKYLCITRLSYSP